MEWDGLLTADGTPPESDMLSKLKCVREEVDTHAVILVDGDNT